jgi:hypothetical protein
MRDNRQMGSVIERERESRWIALQQQHDAMCQSIITLHIAIDMHAPPCDII